MDGSAGSETSEVERVGRYLLLNKLGQGGMGVVYAAYDPNLDRRVALKLLRSDAGKQSWLLREGQALGRLAHPNVVGVHEIGQHDGHIFLAMELVEGPTLKSWVEERRHPALEIIQRFVEAGHGLAAAHAAGLVHRDFKPDNVLIGKDGRVRVSDFGIAALSEAPLPENTPPLPSPPTSLLTTPLTSTNSRVGTPVYMSPEQFRGGPVTAASDQWSFCVALYQAIYGVLPFPAGNMRELMWSVQYEAPASPPRLAEAPLWLGPILLRGLSRDPAQRFASMTELLTAIERYLPGDPRRDPMGVVRERDLLSVSFFVSVVIYLAAYLTDTGVRLMTEPPGMFAIPAFLAALVGTLVALRWKQLSRNIYGQQVAAAFLVGSLLLLLQHFVGWNAGLRGPQIIIEDMVVITVLYAIVAGTLERWVGWLAAVGLCVTCVAALRPAWAARMMALSAVLNGVAMGIRLYVDRHMRLKSDSPAKTEP